jgi:hypothetical protein
MAVLGILLCAHHRNWQHLDPTAKSLQTPGEYLGVRHRVVAHMATLVVEVLPLRPATELVPEEDVPYTGPVQCLQERLAVKPRRIARGRPGTHVGDALNFMCAQQGQEMP